MAQRNMAVSRLRSICQLQPCEPCEMGHQKEEDLNSTEGKAQRDSSKVEDLRVRSQVDCNIHAVSICG